MMQVSAEHDLVGQASLRQSVCTHDFLLEVQSKDRRLRAFLFRTSLHMQNLFFPIQAVRGGMSRRVSHVAAPAPSPPSKI